MMNLLSIFESPIQRRRRIHQWYIVTILFYTPNKYAIIGDRIVDIGWRTEEAIIEHTFDSAHNTYNRFLNHYGRYTNTCKISIYVQCSGYRDKVKEIIIVK